MRLNTMAYAIAFLMLGASFALGQTAQTLTGTVSDTMCGKKHAMNGMSAAQCTRACVKQGADYALVVGDKVYTIKGDKSAIDKFAGEDVVVKGEVSGSTVTLESIKAAS